MADWVDPFHEALEFERGLLGNTARTRKPQVLMSRQLWEDIKAYSALDAEVSAAMDIAEDDRWQTGSKPTTTSSNSATSWLRRSVRRCARSLGSVVSFPLRLSKNRKRNPTQRHPA